MSHGWFIAGTDTGVGKTGVACALLAAFARQGHSVVGMKPVASGCQSTSAGLRSADAEALAAASSVVVRYEDINPYAFETATAPHLAARAAGIEISIDNIVERYASLARQAQRVVVEGVGGWLVPVGSQQTMADVASSLALPVILVVGVRLGALNHALLTAAAIRASGARLAAWVANRIDPDAVLEGYVEALNERLDVPLLGHIPYDPAGTPARWQHHLDLAPLAPR